MASATRNFHPLLEYPFMRCFLIRSIDARSFLNRYGVVYTNKPEYESLVKPHFEIHGTGTDQSFYTKITIQADTKEKIELGTNAFLKIMDGIKQKYPKATVEKINQYHCTICFRENHTKERCNACGWCLKYGRKKIDCRLRNNFQKTQSSDKGTDDIST